MNHIVEGVCEALESSNISVKFDEEYQIITLVYSANNGVKSVMTIEEPYIRDKKYWEKFRDNIKNDETGGLGFGGGNGEVSLTYQCSSDDSDGLIQYTVRTGGSGGDGRITMSFEKSNYGETFIDIINIILEKDYLWDIPDLV